MLHGQGDHHNGSAELMVPDTNTTLPETAFGKGVIHAGIRLRSAQVFRTG